MNEIATDSTPTWWHPVLELVIHVLIGSALFAIIFAPAIGLDILIKRLQEYYTLSSFLIGLLNYTKYSIASIDAFLYITFMLRMGWLFLVSLLKMEQ